LKNAPIKQAEIVEGSQSKRANSKLWRRWYRFAFEEDNEMLELQYMGRIGPVVGRSRLINLKGTRI
jgi:hypothetical protein